MGLIGDILTGVGEGLQQVDVIGGRERIDRQAQLKIENERAGRQEESQKAQTTLGTLMTVLGATPEVRSQMANSDEAKNILESMGLGENFLSSITKLGDQNVKFLLDYIKRSGTNNPEEFLKQLTGQLAGRPITDQLAIIDPILKQGKAQAGREEIQRLTAENSRQEVAEEEDLGIVEAPTPPVTSLVDTPAEKKKESATNDRVKILEKKLDVRRKSIEKDFAFIEKILNNKKITEEQKDKIVDRRNKIIKSKQGGLASLVDSIKNAKAGLEAGEPPNRDEILNSPEWQASLAGYLKTKDAFDRARAAGADFDEEGNSKVIRVRGLTEKQVDRKMKANFGGRVADIVDIIIRQYPLTKEERQARLELRFQ